MSHTRKETDIWGNEKEVHYDDSGNKVGETRYRETLFGNKVQDHYDTSGNKVGETRREEGLFSDKAVFYDADGNRAGYTKDDETLFGAKIQRHYDRDGESVGTSHYEDTLFGARRKVHEGEYFKGGSSVASSSRSRGSDAAGCAGPLVSLLGIATVVFLIMGGLGTTIGQRTSPSPPRQPQPYATPNVVEHSPSLSSAPAQGTFRPSFDCSRATHESEMLICSSNELSNLDQSLAVAYANATKRNPTQKAAIRKSQLHWLRQVRDRCPDVQCLASTYRNRISELSSSPQTDTYASIGHPSFDCSAAKYRSEMLVCSSAELSRLDVSLAMSYREALARHPGKQASLRKAQLSWLRNVRDNCADVGCLASNYRIRIAELDQW